jgi:hypothetical protein
MIATRNNLDIFISLSARQNVICKNYVLPQSDRSVRGIALQINQNATL